LVSEPATVTIKDFNTDEKSTWCPGCGDFGIVVGLKRALTELGIGPHQVMFTSGIGCGSKLPHYMWANEFNSLHGRPVPVATGIRLAAPNKFTVISVSGDGDSYGIGVGHLIHTARRNVNMVQVVENNQVYALTKGQYSPTSQPGLVTTTSPEGSIEAALNGLGTAIMAGASFVGRGFSGDPRGMADLLARAIEHPGYALVEILQDCVIYNRVNTTKWYRERIYDLQEEDHDTSDMRAAIDRSLEWGDRIPTGILFQNTERPTYEDQVPAIKVFGGAVDRDLAGEFSPEDLAKMLDDYA
jgi:2-oxoglutarate ferredoxin oxidoreductase subunit beta